jgi:hypothetical protein
MTWWRLLRGWPAGDCLVRLLAACELHRLMAPGEKEQALRDLRPRARVCAAI